MDPPHTEHLDYLHVQATGAPTHVQVVQALAPHNAADLIANNLVDAVLIFL